MMAGIRPHLESFVRKTPSRLQMGSGGTSGEVGGQASPEQTGGGQLSYRRERIGRQKTALLEWSSQAMSNLLSANIDVGLGHAISMGYDVDVGVRLAFTEVLTAVLRQGTEFDMLAETVTSDRYAKLVRLIVAPDLYVAKALSQVLSNELLDELSMVLIRVFDAHECLVPFLFRVVEWEVEVCRTAQTLFRRNSLATKLATACAKDHGQAYLRQTIGPILTHMLTTPKMSYEVDPTRLREGESLEENQARLRQLVKTLFSRIFDSADQLPVLIRLLCHAIRRGTQTHFPEAALSAVGGLLFLRFITPALVSPQAHGICDTPSQPPMHRGLLLASKILQVACC